MKVDLPERQWKKIDKAIKALDSLDFPEVSDGNKLSELWWISETLNGFSIELFEQLEI